MTRCDPRLVKVIRECAAGRRPSDQQMADVALALGLIGRARSVNGLWPTALGVEVARAVHRV